MHKVVHNKLYHETHIISGSNSHIFRHQVAILRKFFSDSVS